MTDINAAYRRGVADATELAAALVELSPADRATIVNHLKSIASRVASEPLNGHLSDLFRADRASGEDAAGGCPPRHCQETLPFDDAGGQAGAGARELYQPGKADVTWKSQKLS